MSYTAYIFCKQCIYTFFQGEQAPGPLWMASALGAQNSYMANYFELRSSLGTITSCVYCYMTSNIMLLYFTYIKILLYYTGCPKKNENS